MADAPTPQTAAPQPVKSEPMLPKSPAAAKPAQNAETAPSLPPPPQAAVRAPAAETSPKMPAAPQDAAAPAASTAVQLSEYDRWVKDNPDQVFTAARDALAAPGKLELAQKLFEDFLRLHPTDPRSAEVKGHLGLIYGDASRWDAAEKMLREYVGAQAEQQEKPANYAAAKFVLAQASYQLSRTNKERLNQAKQDLEQYLADHKEDAYVKYAQGFLGDVLRDMQKPAEAVAAYQSALGLLTAPADAERAKQISINLSHVRSKTGADGAGQAITELDALIKQGKLSKPNEIADAYLMIGGNHIMLAEAAQDPAQKAAHYQSAAAAYDEGLKAAPEWPQAGACRDSWASCQTAHARLLASGGKTEESLALCDAVIAQSDKIPNKAFVNDAQLIRGIIQYQQKKSGEAEASLAAFIQNAPFSEQSSAELKADRTQALALLATLCADKSPPDFASAQSHLITLHAENPNSPEALRTAIYVAAKAAEAQNWTVVADMLTPVAERLVQSNDLSLLTLVKAQLSLNRPEAVINQPQTLANITKLLASIAQDPNKAGKEGFVVDAVWRVVRALQAAGKTAEADQLITAVFNAYPQSQEAANRLWNDSQNLRKTDAVRADALLERLLGLTADKQLADDAHYELGRSAYSQKNYGQVIKHCQTLIQHEKYGDTALGLLCQSAYELKDYNAAVEYCTTYQATYKDGQSIAAVKGIYARACLAKAELLTSAKPEAAAEGK